MVDENRFDRSRRETPGIAGALGTSSTLGGAATVALPWGEAKFGNPGVLQGGELDFEVDWKDSYYGRMETPTISSGSDDGATLQRAERPPAWPT